MHKTGFLRNFGNFKIPVLLFLILSVLQIFLIAESEGRMLANNHVKPQPVRKSSSAPGLLFGDPDRLEGTPGQRSLYEEIQADEEYVRDLILKRIKRSAANDKADREYEEDNEEEEELEAEEAERKEESAVAKEEEALKLKKDAEKLKKEAEKNKNATTSTKPPTLTQASSTTAPSTTPIAANSNSLLTKAPSTTPLPANSNAPLAAPQTGTTTMKPTVSNATNAGQRSNTTLPQGQRPSGPPRGPPPNGTIAYRTITLANGTKIQQQVRLPPGTVLGKPPPGSRPGPPGGKPPFPIPPHLLMMNNNAPAKPKANKGELYLPEDYNRLEIPKLDAGKIFGIKVDKLSPVPVLVFLNIRSIRDIDETNGEIVMDLDMKLEWVDGVLFNPVDALRGKHSKPITLNPVFLKKIWQPDIYIDELVRVRKVSLMAKPETVLFSPGTGLVSDTFRGVLYRVLLGTKSDEPFKSCEGIIVFYE